MHAKLDEPTATVLIRTEAGNELIISYMEAFALISALNAIAPRMANPRHSTSVMSADSWPAAPEKSP